MFELVIEDREARILIDRGGRRNAVPIREWGELEKCVRAANTSKAHLVTIASSDPRSFCAGADMAELTSLASDEKMRRKFIGAMDSAFNWIRRTSKPTVALVQGACFGVGVGLATACDIRVAHPDACFSVTPARFGMSYPKADIEALVRLVGPGQTARLIYGGERIGGREAQAIGLAEILDESSESFGRAFVERVTANVQSSLCSLKATMLDRWDAKGRFADSFTSPDFVKAMTEFHEGRA